MKSVFVVLAFALGVNALTKEQMETIIKKVVEVGKECIEQEKATQDDFTELVSHKIPPSTHSAKCVIACLYEHYKMMTPEGDFDKQAIITAFDELKEMDADMHGKVLKIIDICYPKKKILEDRCETASLMAICVKNEAEKMGLKEELVV